MLDWSLHLSLVAETRRFVCIFVFSMLVVDRDFLVVAPISTPMFATILPAAARHVFPVRGGSGGAGAPPAGFSVQNSGEFPQTFGFLAQSPFMC